MSSDKKIDEDDLLSSVYYPLSNSKSVSTLIPSVLSPFWECGAERVNRQEGAAVRV